MAKFCEHYWEYIRPIPPGIVEAFRKDAGLELVRYVVRCRYCGKREER